MLSVTSFAMAVVAIAVCSSALPTRDQEVDLLSKIGSNHISGDRFDGNGHKVRNLDPLGGGNLMRDVREIRHPEFIPLLTARRFEYGSGYRRINPAYRPEDFTRIIVEAPKRNFDEIDRTSFDRFVKKRNFDEIDHSSFGSFSKRNDNAYPIAIQLYEDKR